MSIFQSSCLCFPKPPLIPTEEYWGVHRLTVPTTGEYLCLLIIWCRSVWLQRMTCRWSVSRACPRPCERCPSDCHPEPWDTRQSPCRWSDTFWVRLRWRRTGSALKHAKTNVTRIRLHGAPRNLRGMSLQSPSICFSMLKKNAAGEEKNWK